MNPPEPYIAWPGWPHLRASTLMCIATCAWFGLIYGGCDWITRHRTFRVRVDFDWEQSIPFVPAWTLAYMSIYLMFAASPLILRTAREMRSASLAIAAIIGVAGIAFLALPADLAYPPPPPAGMWQPLFDLADRLNLDCNLAPSLHVGLSSLTALILAGRAPLGFRLALGAWALSISLSTLLTHQHHVVDVITGHALAAAGYLCVYRPAVRGPRPLAAPAGHRV